MKSTINMTEMAIQQDTLQKLSDSSRIELEKAEMRYGLKSRHQN